MAEIEYLDRFAYIKTYDDAAIMVMGGRPITGLFYSAAKRIIIIPRQFVESINTAELARQTGRDLVETALNAMRKSELLEAPFGVDLVEEGSIEEIKHLLRCEFPRELFMAI